MIVFIGDSPSNSNLNPEVPFVGTQSYKKLLEWIYRLNISINDVMLVNQCDLGPDDFFALDIPDNAIVALGKVAALELRRHKIVNYFELPHPSPRNRKLNDRVYESEELKKCKAWLKTKKH